MSCISVINNKFPKVYFKRVEIFPWGKKKRDPNKYNSLSNIFTRQRVYRVTSDGEERSRSFFLSRLQICFALEAKRIPPSVFRPLFSPRGERVTGKWKISFVSQRVFPPAYFNIWTEAKQAVRGKAALKAAAKRETLLLSRFCAYTSLYRFAPVIEPAPPRFDYLADICLRFLSFSPFRGNTFIFFSGEGFWKWLPSGKIILGKILPIIISRLIELRGNYRFFDENDIEIQRL